ncbi:hypothetical protein JCM10212_002937 [Sporobolomyces blumeae]
MQALDTTLDFDSCVQAKHVLYGIYEHFCDDAMTKHMAGILTPHEHIDILRTTSQAALDIALIPPTPTTRTVKQHLMEEEAYVKALSGGINTIAVGGPTILPCHRHPVTSAPPSFRSSPYAQGSAPFGQAMAHAPPQASSS